MVGAGTNLGEGEMRGGMGSGRAAPIAVAVACLLAGCGGSSPSRSQLARASARIVESDFASTLPFGTPRRLKAPADRAKVALLENIEVRLGGTQLPKTYDYCVAYRAGTDYPAAGLARLSVPAGPFATGLSANFKRVEKRLVIECDEQEAPAFRSELTKELRVPEEELALATGRFPSYAPCADRRVLEYLTDQRLARQLVLEFLHPRAAATTALEVGYHLGIDCAAEAPTVRAFRSALVASSIRELVRGRAPAAFISCVSAELRANLTARDVHSLLAIPALAFQRATARSDYSNTDHVLSTLHGEIRAVLRARAASLGRRVGEQCVAQQRV